MIKGEPYRALSSRVRRYDLRSLLGLIGYVSSRRLFEPDEVNRLIAGRFPYPNVAFLDFFLSNVAKAAIEVEPQRYFRRDRLPKIEDLGILQNMFMECTTGEGIETLEDFQAYFLRTANLQFPSQRPPWKQIPRAVLLYTSALGRVDSYDPALAFEDSMGMPIEDFIFLGIGFAMLSQVNETGRVDPAILRKIGFRAFEEDRIAAFLNHTATSEEQLRASIRRVVRIPGFEIYEHNPLVERPIIRYLDGELLLPIPRYLIDRVTAGLYYYLVKRDGERFLNHLGKAFEVYVGRLFSHLEGLIVEPERSYGPKRLKRETTDWLIASDLCAMLLECKTKRLRVGSEVPHRPKQLLDDLKAGAVNGVRQLHTTASAIAGKQVFSEFSEHRLLPLVVFLESCFTFNADPIRSLISIETGIDPDTFVYQICSVDEIEDLATLKPQEIMRILANKMDAIETRQNDLSTAINPGSKGTAHPLLEQTWTAFMNEYRLEADVGPKSEG